MHNIKIGYNSSAAASEVIDSIYRSYYKTKEYLLSDEFSGSVKIRLSWVDKNTVLAFISSILSPSLTRLQLSKTDENELVLCIAEAFTSSVTASVDGGMVPYVHFECVTSSKFRSTLLTDTLLLDIPCRDIFSLRRKTATRMATIAIFESSIELPVSTTVLSYEFDESNSDSTSSMTEMEREVLRACAKIIKTSGIDVLFCQRRIHGYLNSLLEKMNIMTIQRVSIRYVSALARLSGAPLLGELNAEVIAHGTLPATSLGALKSVEWKCYCGKKFLVCEGLDAAECVYFPDSKVFRQVINQKLPIMTVLIGGLNDSFLSELANACERVIKVLSLALKEPFLLRGGGQWQYILGKRICNAADTSTLTYAHLENSILCDRYLGISLIEYSNLISGNKGCTDRENSIDYLIDINATDELLIDSFTTSIRAIEHAVEAACCILSIDGVVYAIGHTIEEDQK